MLSLINTTINNSERIILHKLYQIMEYEKKLSKEGNQDNILSYQSNELLLKYLSNRIEKNEVLNINPVIKENITNLLREDMNEENANLDELLDMVENENKKSLELIKETR